MKCILTTLLLLAIITVIGLAWLDQTPLPAAVSYETALALTSADRVNLMGPGSAREEDYLERFKMLWSNFTPEYLSHNLSGVYAPDVWFNDTIKTITNHVDLEHYMVETASRVASCKIEFINFIHTDDGYFSRWKMSILPDAKNPDDEWVSYGISHLRFNEDGLVVLHQDYWDPAGGLYEHLPGIGWILRNIRARL